MYCRSTYYRIPFTNHVTLLPSGAPRQEPRCSEEEHTQCCSTGQEPGACCDQPLVAARQGIGVSSFVLHCLERNLWARRCEGCGWAPQGQRGWFIRLHFACRVRLVGWPSGLRRWFKAPVTSVAWVRIPPLPLFSLFSSLSTMDCNTYLFLFLLPILIAIIKVLPVGLPSCLVASHCHSG